MQWHQANITNDNYSLDSVPAFMAPNGLAMPSNLSLHCIGCDSIWSCQKPQSEKPTQTKTENKNQVILVLVCFSAYAHIALILCK